MLLGGLLLAALLVLAEQWIAAVAVALFALFMGYWTSPLRSGPHTPLSVALEHPGDGVAIVLWVPGNPLSARLQAAIRGPREDVVWVNVYRDEAAQQLLATHGGAEALPLVLVEDEVKANSTAGELLELQHAVRQRHEDRHEDGDVTGP